MKCLISLISLNIFVENLEDYQHIIRSGSVDIFDIFEMLGTVRDVWVVWDDLHFRQNSARRIGEPASGGCGLARRMRREFAGAVEPFQGSGPMGCRTQGSPAQPVNPGLWR
jgi:hypothetical protein